MVKTNHSIQRGSAFPQKDPGIWQFIYTGFILMLLCFFIMLTSFASFQQSRITQFVASFSKAVSVFDHGSSLEEGRAMLKTDAMILNKENQMALLFERVSALGRQVGLDQVAISRSQRGVIMTLTEKLLFASGDARITAKAYPILDKISQIIQSLDIPVDIEGHTDNVPIRTAAYRSNWELSTARAVNVLRYMVEQGHVHSQRLSAVGFSKYQPVASNESPTQRAKNRRVEIVFKPV